MSNPTGKGGFGERKSAINRKGRPRSFDQLRALAQQIAHEALTAQDGTQKTVVEGILRKMVMENPEKFIEYAFGKVPQPVEHSGKDGEAIKIQIVDSTTDGHDND